MATGRTSHHQSKTRSQAAEHQQFAIAGTRSSPSLYRRTGFRPRRRTQLLDHHRRAGRRPPSTVITRSITASVLAPTYVNLANSSRARCMCDGEGGHSVKQPSLATRSRAARSSSISRRGSLYPTWSRPDLRRSASAGSALTGTEADTFKLSSSDGTGRKVIANITIGARPPHGRTIKAN